MSAGDARTVNEYPISWLRSFCILGEDAALHFGLGAPEARADPLIIVSLRNTEFTLEVDSVRGVPRP